MHIKLNSKPSGQFCRDTFGKNGIAQESHCIPKSAAAFEKSHGNQNRQRPVESVGTVSCRIGEDIMQKPVLKLPFCTLYCEDILLLSLIMVLLNEGCDETLLLALVYIFLSGLEKQNRIK